MINFDNLKKISDYDLNDSNTVIQGYILMAEMYFEDEEVNKIIYPSFVSYGTKNILSDGPYISFVKNIMEAILFPTAKEIIDNREEIEYQLNHNFPYYHVKEHGITHRWFQLTFNLGAIT